jgi:hypothetical protein
MAKTIEDAPPVAVFQGYDSVTGAGRSTEVSGQTARTGGTSEVTCQVCEDTKILAEALDVSGSLSVGFADIGSIDVKAQFISNLNLTANSVSIVVYASHIQGTESATNVEMTPGVNPPGSDSNAISGFFSGYGDSYLSSVTTGGEYYAVYAFYSETQDEKQSLLASMQAQGVYAGVSVDATLQANIDNLVKTTTSRTSLYQNISGIQNPQLPDGTDIVKFANNFPSLPLDAPTVLSFESSGYEHVPGFGTFGAVPNNRSYFVGSSVVDGLTASLVSVQQLSNQITWLKEIYQFYGFTAGSDTTLMDAENDVGIDVGAINNQIQAWENNPTQPFTPLSLNSLTYGTPSLNCTIGTTPLWGSTQGTTFNDVPANCLQKRFRLSSVQMYSDPYWIDTLMVTYESDDGSQQFQYGPGNGSHSPQLTLSPGQFVNSVTGTYGGTDRGAICSLTITSPDGRSITGGQAYGGQFSWSTTSFTPPVPPTTVAPGSVFLGFGGNQSPFLNGLQVIYATIQPANWQMMPQARRDGAHS